VLARESAVSRARIARALDMVKLLMDETKQTSARVTVIADHCPVRSVAVTGRGRPDALETSKASDRYAMRSHSVNDTGVAMERAKNGSVLVESIQRDRTGVDAILTMVMAIASPPAIAQRPLYHRR
jgi:hypothetical protein